MEKLLKIKQKIREAGGSDRFSLADVLLAMSEKQMQGKSFGLSVNLHGGIYQTLPPKFEERYVCDWNLRADDFNLQDTPTKLYIYELLK